MTDTGDTTPQEKTTGAAAQDPASEDQLTAEDIEEHSARAQQSGESANAD